MNWVPGLHRIPEDDDGHLYAFDMQEYVYMNLVRNY